jgi:methylated-DNA-[protein]-cysteine S-methyltransferase
MKNYRTFLNSKIGFLEITGTDEGIASVNFVDEKQGADKKLPVHMQKCRTELDEYFKGKRKKFSVDLKIEGTDFQKKVWKELVKIPYGENVSYRDVAAAVGNPKGGRAVGGAVGRNNISIIIPCHRVIGSSGDLTGFGGGLWRKEWLLNHESRHSRSGQ